MDGGRAVDGDRTGLLFWFGTRLKGLGGGLATAGAIRTVKVIANPNKT